MLLGSQVARWSGWARRYLAWRFFRRPLLPYPFRVRTPAQLKQGARLFACLFLLFPLADATSHAHQLGRDDLGDLLRIMPR